MVKFMEQKDRIFSLKELRARRAWVFVPLLFHVGCGPDLPPSNTVESCKNICASITCYQPETTDETLSQCRIGCEEKYEESARQNASCEMAFAEGMECVSDLSCEQFMDWYSSGDPDPCPTARMNVADSCVGIFLEPEILPP